MYITVNERCSEDLEQTEKGKGMPESNSVGHDFEWFRNTWILSEKGVS